MIKIVIPFRPYSINNMYYSDRRHGMRKEAKEWCYQVNHVLNTYKYDFDFLKSQFDEKLHGLSVKIICFYSDFYTKSGNISSKVFDITNVEKLIVDLVIDARHHGKAPYKSPNLNINDKNIIELISKKSPGSEDSIEILINIVSLPKI